MDETRWNYILGGFNIIFGIANVWFVYLVYKYTTRDINPKLSMTPMRDNDLVNSEMNYDNCSQVWNIDFNQKGFPDSSLRHTRFVWKLIIKNYSDLPAINVIVDYSIVIKKAVYDYLGDCTEVYEHKMENFKTIKNSSTFPYIGAQSEVCVPLIEIDGSFLEADLIVSSMKSDELQFIKNALKIDTYQHPHTRELEDSNHYRLLIGAYKPTSNKPSTVV